jgi:phage shock protein E
LQGKTGKAVAPVSNWGFYIYEKLNIKQVKRLSLGATMSYTSKFQNLADVARSKVDEVAAKDVSALMAQGAVALDIRDPDEHAAGHIPGSVHLSRGKLEMNIEGILPDLDTTILCYCNAFNRGALSAASLRDMGYRNARFIAGGLNAWRKLEGKA